MRRAKSSSAFTCWAVRLVGWKFLRTLRSSSSCEGHHNCVKRFTSLLASLPGVDLPLAQDCQPCTGTKMCMQVRSTVVQAGNAPSSMSKGSVLSTINAGSIHAQHVYKTYMHVPGMSGMHMTTGAVSACKCSKQQRQCRTGGQYVPEACVQQSHCPPPGCLRPLVYHSPLCHTAAAAAGQWLHHPVWGWRKKVPGLGSHPSLAPPCAHGAPLRGLVTENTIRKEGTTCVGR